jgi:hypothetical protein
VTLANCVTVKPHFLGESSRLHGLSQALRWAYKASGDWVRTVRKDVEDTEAHGAFLRGLSEQPIAFL